MSRRNETHRERTLAGLIVLLCLIAVVLIAAIIIEFRMPAPAATPVQSVQTTVDIPKETAAPLTLTVSLPPVEATVTPEPTPTPTPAPVITDPEYEFLPVYNKADTKEKVVAITIDDCSHQSNMRTIAVEAYKHDAKLTLFPYGEAVMHEGMDSIIRTCILQLGYQVENRTWSNRSLHKLDDDVFAADIWTTDIAVDYVLNKNYDMHLLRMRGGSGIDDARTHEYLKKLGYDGIVTWTVDANGKSARDLQDSLAPGNIYVFAVDNVQTELLVDFFDYLDDAGYRCVTLNELLGFEENALTDPEMEILDQELIPAVDTSVLYLTQSIGSRTYQSRLIQMRLEELGYLEAGSADGIYGSGTSSAVSAFQANAGMLGTGVADARTQERLFAEDAPANAE